MGGQTTCRAAAIHVLEERGPLHFQDLEDDIATNIYMQFYSDARDALLKTVVE